LATADPEYRRALWIVVILNLGFGAAELIGGLFTGSQALRADALDFLGDGSITLLGLIVLGWSPLARSRVALAQGLFLGRWALAFLLRQFCEHLMPIRQKQA
jgi:Co/Zn/Cd efflux system component